MARAREGQGLLHFPGDEQDETEEAASTDLIQARLSRSSGFWVHASAP